MNTEERKNEFFECRECQKSYTSRRGLRKHLKKCKAEEPPQNVQDLTMKSKEEFTVVSYRLKAGELLPWTQDQKILLLAPAMLTGFVVPPGTKKEEALRRLGVPEQQVLMNDHLLTIQERELETLHNMARTRVEHDKWQ